MLDTRLEPVLVVELDFSEADLADLRAAKLTLENPGLAARIAGFVGSPIEAGFKYLPAGWQQKVGEVTQSVLMKGLDFAILTMGNRGARDAQNWLHKSLVAVSGGFGGVAGLASLPVELPVSTGIMLRSIADIARSEGHNLARLDVRLSCLEVLALGGRSAGDDAVDSGYWAVRVALARTFANAAAYIAENGLSDKAAPALVKFITAIAARFSTIVSEEIAAKAVPVVGAVSGSLINLLFLHHFQEMARGHFIIKRLEEKYGAEVVEKQYQACVA
jgi:hypothetical protein